MNTPNCPKCQGPMFDETKSQYWNGGKTAQGKAKPMFKCKAKGQCDGVVWRLDDATSPAAAPGSHAGAPKGAVPSSDRLKDIFAVYEACYIEACRIVEVHAERLPKEVAGRVDVPAIAATLVIQAFK